MSGQGKVRILCVSHSSLQLKAMRELFPLREYQVFLASTPEQAVALCISNPLAAVVLDSEFTSDGGWTAPQTLRSVNAQLPILILNKGHTGKVPPGVDAVVKSPDILLPTLEKLLSDGRK
jgi:DNA-binding response OmpR family regulator